MAKYNVVLTVRDKYGKDKEVDGGTVDIDIASLALSEINAIAGALKLDDYATDIELADAIKDVPTVDTVKETIKTDLPIVIEKNTEVQQVLTEVVEKHLDVETIKYGSFVADDEEV